MIDLHSHTKYSDGSSSVAELLDNAQKLGLSLLSITDHNTIDAHYDLENMELRRIFGGKIISGVEITTTYNGETIEVLGYGFDLDMMKEFLEKNVLTFEEKQLKEYELIRDQYRKIGVIFNEDNIIFDPSVESSRIAFCNEIKKHSENFKFFLNKDSIYTNSGFTRNEVYNPKSPLYVDESTLFPSLDVAIEMIHQSGGVAFLAHTFAYSKNIFDQLDDILDNYNLDGLECFYTTFTEKQANYLVGVCKRRNLFMSGGSDFHGTRKVNHNLGTGSGNLCISDDVVANWIGQFIPDYYSENRK